MIVEGNDYTTDYFEEENGFRCKLTGKNHRDVGIGQGATKEEAFDDALANYRTKRERREDDFVDKTREEALIVE